MRSAPYLERLEAAQEAIDEAVDCLWGEDGHTGLPIELVVPALELCRSLLVTEMSERHVPELRLA